MQERVKPISEEKRARGYDIPVGSETDRAIVALQETNVGKSIAYALLFHAGLVVPWMLLAWASSNNALWLAAIPVVWVWTASRQRALENLVHDGSHYNWSRRNKACNDVSVNVLAAWPVMLDVREYREPHLRHHKLFDTALDPCRRREVMRGDVLAGTGTRIERLLVLAPCLWSLNAEFFRTQMSGGGGERLIRYAVWHGLVFGVPLAVKFGPWLAVVAWVTCWLVPQMLVLPVIRAVAEAEEHNYEVEGTELDATFTNDGFVSRWLVHPAGDAYHAAHHLRMGVPAYRMKALDRLLRNSTRYARHPRRG